MNCIFLGYSKYATFNFADQMRAVACKEHSKEGIVNVLSNKCRSNDCVKQPSYNFPNQNRAVVCKEIHISEAIARPTYFIRYNPDAYHVNGAIVCVRKSVREKQLIHVIREYLFSNDFSNFKNDIFLMETVFLYYDENNTIK